jgi:hypothetical protein
MIDYALSWIARWGHSILLQDSLVATPACGSFRFPRHPCISQPPVGLDIR